MDPHENASQHNSTSSQSAAGSDITRDQLQKRLERFKRRMNKKMEGNMSGRTTPASSIGGPPSEYGRALSTVSVPAIRHYQHVNSAPTLKENIASSGIDNETSRTLAARAQLVRTLMQENEALKSTLDKWAPAVSAYRTCHALVQELGKKVEEKDAAIAQLSNALKDVDHRGNDSKLKLAEYERRMELKDAALNQLKSKVIELKAQLENAQLAEAELRRQQQRGGFMQSQQQQNQQQQQQMAAMAAMTMQLQRELAEGMSQLRQRDQELAALTSERDGLHDACNQLQQALQAATSAAVVPISMEMSFRPPRSALCDRQTQTEPSNYQRPVLPSTAARVQTDPFTLPNMSVCVQFSSVDLQPVVIDLPDNYEKPTKFSLLKEAVCPSPDLVDGSCQWSDDQDMLMRNNTCMQSTQCRPDDFVIMCDADSQSEEANTAFVIEEKAFVEVSVQSDCQFELTERISISCETDLLGAPIQQFEMATQTDAAIISDCANDPLLPIWPDNWTQTDVASTTELGAQTLITEMTEEGTNPFVEAVDGETQVELPSNSNDMATDAEHSVFSLKDSFSQPDFFSSADVQCQAYPEPDLIAVVCSPEPVVTTADAETQTSCGINVTNAGSDPFSFVQHVETQVDSERKLSTDAGTDARLSLFSVRDASSQKESNGEVVTIACQVSLNTSHSERPESPSESIMSLSSDCLSANVNTTAGNTEQQQQQNKTLSEIDALRAAVRLLSREKRDLQSKLAQIQISKSGRPTEFSRTATPLGLMPGISSPSPSRFMSPSSPSSDGVHSSLSAIQRKITELREQLAAANAQQPLSPSTGSLSNLNTN